MQVQKIPTRDHNAPLLHDLVNFLEQASAWLNLNMHNVVAVHCQGGKGESHGSLRAAMHQNISWLD